MLAEMDICHRHTIVFSDENSSKNFSCYLPIHVPIKYPDWIPTSGNYDSVDKLSLCGKHITVSNGKNSVELS